jgi:hypothetical protein
MIELESMLAGWESQVGCEVEDARYLKLPSVSLKQSLAGDGNEA